MVESAKSDDTYSEWELISNSEYLADFGVDEATNPLLVSHNLEMMASAFTNQSLKRIHS